MRSGVHVLQVGFIVVAAFLCGRASAQDAPAVALTERMVMDKALVIERVSGGGGGGGRSAAAIDAVQRLLVTGEWRTPKAGDEITLSDGSKRAWSEVEVGDDGALPAQNTRGGYALWLVESDEEMIMLLKASGHGMAYVNGEPRAGDPYTNGIVMLPVKLHKGVNEILLHCPRGAVKAELLEPAATIMLSATDATLPDLVRGSNAAGAAGLLLINAGPEAFVPVTLRCYHAGGSFSFDNPPVIPAMSARKVGFQIPPPPENFAAGASSIQTTVTLAGRQASDSTTLTFDVPVVEPGSLHKRTFASDIDGSVQYFAVRPALVGGPDNGLILTLHGAGVEARGQAAAYKSKDWAHIVAATNRRPFGFDWEDWGRIDALEVLDIAKKDLAHDPQRIYLTGHSMGGHGTWQIGSTFPGEFAAIAPSAGWISFETYGGGRGGRGGGDASNVNPIQQIMRRAGNASRTLELQRNLDGMGVYILHGDKDDNVPVEQARTMKAELEKWHGDLTYHEQPGAGHWWGDECVDWPPLMEFLKAHVKPPVAAIDHIVFATASPGVSATRDWVTIQQQQRWLDFSRVDLKRDLAKRTFAGTTENVARLTLDVSAFNGAGEVSVELDGQVVRARASPQAAGTIDLVRSGEKWEVAAGTMPNSQKTPARSGPFKSAFNHRFMFIYGTKGAAEENAWAFNKARFDAETFWYRGNGSVDIVADVDFNPREAASRDRSVIIYGNADTNAAWQAQLGDSPVQIRRGSITVGERKLDGEDLACLLVRPRPGSDIASVGVVSGTGLIGARITDRLSYFVSGVAYPDCIIFDGSGLTRGALGIKAAGFFGNDWTIESGEFAWQQP